MSKNRYQQSVDALQRNGRAKGERAKPRIHAGAAHVGGLLRQAARGASRGRGRAGPIPPCRTNCFGLEPTAHRPRHAINYSPEHPAGNCKRNRDQRSS